MTGQRCRYKDQMIDRFQGQGGSGAFNWPNPIVSDN